MMRLALLASLTCGALIGAGPRQPTPTAPHRHIIEMRGMGFHPAQLTVPKGDTIIWINRDIVPHTATAVRKGGAVFDTGPLIKSGDSSVYVARTPGPIRYYCMLHPVMKGALLVR